MLFFQFNLLFLSVRSRFDEGAESDSDEAEYNSDDDDSSDEGEDETQRIISYLVFDDPEFVNNLQFVSCRWEDAIVYTDRIFFKADIMTSLQKYLSEMKSHFKVDWTVKTRCNNNRLNVGGIISRKIKFKPLFISIGLLKTFSEFDLIRSNYFCYTYEEMNYILEFGDIYAEENRENNMILSYFKVLDIATISKTCISVTQKYFCAINNDCIIKYDRNDSILRCRTKTSAKYADNIDDLLSLLKNFKTCATCDRPLQVWVKEKDFAEISDVFEDPPDIIVTKIFKSLQ